MHFTIINMCIKPHFLFYLIIQKILFYILIFLFQQDYKIYLIKLCDRFTKFLVFICKYNFVCMINRVFILLNHVIILKFCNCTMRKIEKNKYNRQYILALFSTFCLFRFFEILAKNVLEILLLRKDSQLKSRPICKSLTLMVVALANSFSLSIHPFPSTKTISGVKRIRWSHDSQ